MKLFAILGLVSALLTSNVGISAGAIPTAECEHKYTTVISGGERGLYGYYHTYNSSEGIKSCAVTVYYYCMVEQCNVCHKDIRIVSQSGPTREVHSNPNHN